MDIISFLKFIATVLITNSHFGVLYPIDFQILATGGTIGNSLFFFISGYTLYFSNKESFVKWITKRLLRIYMPVWVSGLVFSILLNRWNIFDFIFPNYWFLRAILVFYFIYFIVIKHFKDKLNWILIIVLVGYLMTFFVNEQHSWVIEITENKTYLHWYYYFGIMLFGTLTAQRNDLRPKNNLKTGLNLLSWTSIYYVSKLMIFKFNAFEYQFLIPIALFFICYYAYSLICTINLRSEWVTKPIQFIAGLTLEIYIVQFVIIRTMANLTFPANTLLSIILILLSAYMLNLISTKLMRIIIQK